VKKIGISSRIGIVAIGIASSAPSIITICMGQVSWFLASAMGLYLCYQPFVTNLKHARIFSLLLIFAPAIGWFFYFTALLGFPDMLLDLVFDIALLIIAASMFSDANGRAEGNAPINAVR
jgi:hypothetical protein